VVGIADAEVLSEDREYLKAWQEAGFAGDMAFMQRDPDLLSAPQAIFPSARSIVVIGAFYDRGKRDELPHGHGRVARYAWGRDYHKVLRKRLQMLCQLVERQLAVSLEHRIFADSVPLLERALARRAGLGFVGKNTMVILPRAGSFMFLGEILWDLEVDAVPDTVSSGVVSPVVAELIQARCGGCSRCLDRCPTGALVNERVLDARRCISYLTIEKRGFLASIERAWLGEWIFGCDVCQDVCPFNAISISKRVKPDCEEFLPEFGAGRSLNLVEVLSIRSDGEFVKRFGGTPLMRAKREGLLRNAAVVAANTGVFEALAALKSAVTEDASPIVRGHALWAFGVIGLNSGSRLDAEVKELVRVSERDPDLAVRAEASAIERMVI
jgi:epoxyqueuosine reductase